MCSFSQSTCQAASHRLPGGEVDLLGSRLVWWDVATLNASLGGVALMVCIRYALQRNLGAGWRRVVSRMSPPLYRRRKAFLSLKSSVFWVITRCKMVPLSSPETSVLNHTAPRHNPEDGRINFNRCGVLNHTILYPLHRRLMSRFREEKSP